ncbi:MAG: methane monooxygenase/ammonia monooxygenase subunit A [Nitrosomonas sp.]
MRLIEQGSLRTFGGHTTVIAAFFSAFVSMLMFCVWWYFGKSIAPRSSMSKVKEAALQ